jgi:restriction system protein
LIVGKLTGTVDVYHFWAIQRVSSILDQKDRLMAIPNYEACMLPLLRVVQDGTEWAMKDVTAKLADHFNLTVSEREEMLPSGNSRVIVNRVGWAKTYLKEAGLVQPVKWGVIQITPQGLAVLSDSPAQIDMDYLARFPSFVEFLNRKRAKKDSDDETEPTTTIDTTVTPDE